MNVTKHTENTFDRSDSDSPPASAQPRTPNLKVEPTSSQVKPKNNGKPLSSSKSTIAKPRSSEKDKPVTEIVNQTFTPFDHQAIIVDPFTREMTRDANFEQELGMMLLDLILETHAWGSARPRHESQLAVQKLEEKIVDVVETEKEQEKTRDNLNTFINSMKNALAALTGLS